MRCDTIAPAKQIYAILFIAYSVLSVPDDRTSYFLNSIEMVGSVSKDPLLSWFFVKKPDPPSYSVACQDIGLLSRMEASEWFGQRPPAHPSKWHHSLLSFCLLRYQLGAQSFHKAARSRCLWHLALKRWRWSPEDCRSSQPVRFCGLPEAGFFPYTLLES